jgi:hypothetical protein
LARPYSKVTAPPWFDLSRYAAARDMDAADWYLNLQLRAVIARTAHKLARSYVRSTTPLVRRTQDPLPFSLEGELPPDFLAIFAGREPAPGVVPLRALDVYYFERFRLPEQIREFGRSFTPGEISAGEVPAGFTEPLDRLIEPRLLSVFARIDLSLPDGALVADLRAFLARERRTLAAIPGWHYYAEALRALRGVAKPN